MLYAALVLKTDSEDRNLMRVTATLGRHKRGDTTKLENMACVEYLALCFSPNIVMGKYKEGVMDATHHKKGKDEKFTQLYTESLKGKDSLENLQTYDKHVKSIKINASGILGFENISFGIRSLLRIL